MYKLRLNKDNNLIFNIFEWNYNDFNAEPIIRVKTDDLVSVKSSFSEITNIEIIKANKVYAEFNTYDSYSDINYMGKMFDIYDNKFYDTLAVRLTKTNLVEQVRRIDEQINPVIDEDSMTIEELKERRIKQIAEAGEADVFSGDEVTFDDGTVKTYTFALDDQNNLQTYLNLITQISDKSKVAIPYHAVGEICQNYTAKQIVTVYFTLQIKLLRVYTYVNMLRLYINELDDLSEVKNIYYGFELPQEYQERMAIIMEESLATILEIQSQYDFNDLNAESNNTDAVEDGIEDEII